MAPTKFDAAEDISLRVADLVRKKALRAILEHDQELAAVFDKVAEGIRHDLRATGYTVAQVRDVLERHMGATSEQRLQIVERAIRSAALEARGLDQATFDAVFGEEAATEAARPFDRPSPPTGTPLISLVPGSEDEPPSTV